MICLPDNGPDFCTAEYLGGAVTIVDIVENRSAVVSGDVVAGIGDVVGVLNGGAELENPSADVVLHGGAHALGTPVCMDACFLLDDDATITTHGGADALPSFPSRLFIILRFPCRIPKCEFGFLNPFLLFHLQFHNFSFHSSTFSFSTLPFSPSVSFLFELSSQSTIILSPTINYFHHVPPFPSRLPAWQGHPSLPNFEDAECNLSDPDKLAELAALLECLR